MRGFRMIINPDDDLYLWQRAEHSANLNETRGGDKIFLFLVPETDPGSGEPDGRVQGVPKVVYRESWKNKESMEEAVRTIDDAVDAQTRVTYMYCYASILDLITEVRENRLTHESKERLLRLDDQYQGMARKCIRAQDTHPWDTEKHIRDATALGF